MIQAILAANNNFTAPGFTDEKIYLWLALHCTKAPQELDDDEVITEVKEVSEAEVDDMLRRGDICDAKTISVLMQARLHKGRTPA